MLNQLNYRIPVASTLLLCLAIVFTTGCACPESIPLNQPVVIGKPRLAEIRVVNKRSESIQVLPVAEHHDPILIEPGASWTVRTTVDRVTTPQEWERLDKYGLLYIDDAGQGSILTTLGLIEYFISEGIDVYVLCIDVGDSEPWRVGIRVEASKMSADKPFRGDLVIANDEFVEMRIP